MTARTGSAPEADPNPLATRDRIRVVGDGIYVLGLQGNGFAVDTEDGLLVVDTGPSVPKASTALAALREHTDRPVRWIVYSHGHGGYNHGVRAHLDEADRRGDPPPTIIAQENLVRRYRRYRETAGLQRRLNALQFRRDPADGPPTPPLTFPDVTYTDSHTVHARGRRIQLLWAPSETDDVTAVWLPDDGVLFGSAAVITDIPNVGTPLRTLRDPVRWADTLDRLAALGPRVLVPEFGHPMTEGIDERLRGTAAFLRWMRREVVDRLNAGMDAVTITHDIDYPEGMFDPPWLSETYGHRDFVVRDIVRSETGWWDGNPTSLHPSPPRAAAAAVAAAVTDKQAVLRRARELRDAGRVQEALHVIDILAPAPADCPEIHTARRLKAELCALRAREVTSYISRSLYLAPGREG